MTTTSSGDERLTGFDIYDPEHIQDLHEFTAEVRQTCPVLHSDKYGGHHVLTRYDDVYEVLLDYRRFTSAKGISLADISGEGLQLPPIDLDPPEHGEYRRLLNRFFHPTALAQYEDTLREIAGRLVDSWAEAGTCDVVAQFASPFSARALAVVILNERDPDEIEKIQRVVIHAVEEGSIEAFRELSEVASKYLKRRESDSAEDRDDIMSAIENGTIEGGRRLTDSEKIGAVMLLFLGGLDTTKTEISSIVLHMTEHPGLEDELRQPGTLRSRIDEFLRFDAPVAAQARTVAVDTTVGGVELHQGEKVLLLLASAGRDEAKFDHAAELDFDRVNPHLSFGAGPHRCIGSNFARLQVQVAIEELLARVQHLELQAGQKIHYAAGPGRGPVTVPVLFERRS